MAEIKEALVPDIGDYSDIPVIEVLVAVGDTVAKDQGLVTLESDKATMEVPSAVAGVVKEIKVKIGDTLSEGKVVALIEVAEGSTAPAAAAAPAPAKVEAPVEPAKPAPAAPAPQAAAPAQPAASKPATQPVQFSAEGIGQRQGVLQHIRRIKPQVGGIENGAQHGCLPDFLLGPSVELSSAQPASRKRRAWCSMRILGSSQPAAAAAASGAA